MTFPASALSLNSATVRRLELAAAVDLCVRHEIAGIGVWREQLSGAGGAVRAGALVRDAGLRVSSLCRGGFLTGPDRHRALDDNRAAIAEAHALGAEVLVLVCGGLPVGSRDLSGAREAIADGIGELADDARAAGVRLGVEALHPMFCADRCAVSSLDEALAIAERFDADAVGIVVDAYHVWWDASVLDVIARAGERIASYQVSDWVLPLREDVLLCRGHVGDGCIDFGPLGRAVRDAGYAGMVEVEIFNEAIWDAPAEATAATVVERFAAFVAQ